MNAEITELLNQLLTIGVKLVIAIATVWLAQIAIPWLKQQKVYSLVKILVKAAEKKAEAGAIEKAEKKSLVISLLNACGIEVTDTIDAMIESAVEELDEATAVILQQLSEGAEDEEAAEEKQTE